MGCLLALAGRTPDVRIRPLRLSLRNLGRGLLLGSLVLALASALLALPGWGQLLGQPSGDGPASIGHACHFGGGVAGWLCGRIAQRRARRARLAAGCR